jgi:hypothetical protein
MFFNIEPVNEKAREKPVLELRWKSKGLMQKGSSRPRLKRNK